MSRYTVTLDDDEGEVHVDLADFARSVKAAARKVPKRWRHLGGDSVYLRAVYADDVNPYGLNFPEWGAVMFEAYKAGLVRIHRADLIPQDKDSRAMLNLSEVKHHNARFHTMDVE